MSLKTDPPTHSLRCLFIIILFILFNLTSFFALNVKLLQFKIQRGNH